MPDVVEIYMCKPGQKLDEGALVVSHDIRDKADAKEDAMRKCKINPSLGRIAYYAINEDGDFKAYFSYTNPNVAELQPVNTEQKKVKKKPKKKTFWQKFKSALGV
ncbi:MAG: hypothetical protein HQ503_09750 [Rhodospirillales bacterium]|nr:hypothetical protein [Rhodospirillales bacterium]